MEIEKQKAMREKILKDKEMRRRKAAEGKLNEVSVYSMLSKNVVSSNHQSNHIAPRSRDSSFPSHHHHTIYLSLLVNFVDRILSTEHQSVKIELG